MNPLSKIRKEVIRKARLSLLVTCMASLMASNVNAQIKLTPKPAPKPAPVRTAPAKPTQPAAPVVPRADVEVCWVGEDMVQVQIDDQHTYITPGDCQIMNLRCGRTFKVSIAKPSATYKSTTTFLVDCKGGRLELSLKKAGDSLVYVNLVYETPFALQQRLAKEAANKIAANMVFIPGGTFTMGCTAEQGSDCVEAEKPAHQVTLSSFKMGKYEVTQAEWEAVMGSNPSYFSGCPTCPVESVNWKDVQMFLWQLNALTGANYRLPTEAEWEYAARGGNRQSGTQYSGSDNKDAVAWYDGNSGSKTHPVGQKQANDLGLYDMSGNVWEWCSDWYGGDYYSSSPSSNPRGPSMGTYRVLRGGSWYYSARYCRVSDRFSLTPDDRDSRSGFRLVSPGS